MRRLAIVKYLYAQALEQERKGGPLAGLADGRRDHLMLSTSASLRFTRRFAKKGRVGSRNFLVVWHPVEFEKDLASFLQSPARQTLRRPGLRDRGAGRRTRSCFPLRRSRHHPARITRNISLRGFPSSRPTRRRFSRPHRKRRKPPRFSPPFRRRERERLPCPLGSRVSRSQRRCARRASHVAPALRADKRPLPSTLSPAVSL